MLLGIISFGLFFLLGLSNDGYRYIDELSDMDGVAPLLGTLRECADARGVSMSAVAIAWAISKGALVIVGMKTPEQVKDNLQAMNFKLSGAEVDELEAAAKGAKQATQNIFQTA